jgi:serine/threonine protein phosphatase 1
LKAYFALSQNLKGFFMFKRLLSCLSNGAERPERFVGARPNPDERLAVIGDIHGDLDCLMALIEALKLQAPQARWVFVGDYIDRGDQSLDVLKALREIAKERPETVFLKGNHETMLLDFLSSPETAGNRWMQHGGLQTIANFGGRGLREKNAPEALLNARDQLLAQAPAEILEWIEACPRYWQSGNVAAVHAGADPCTPMAEQYGRSLTWGHRDFGTRARADGLWIVHGHTIVEAPRAHNGIISVDTGAYATGRLTAAVIGDGQVSFVQGVR